MHKILNYLMFTITTIVLSGCGGGNNGDKEPTSKNTTTTAYFGDKLNNRVIVVDVEKMEFKTEIFTGHDKTYAAEVIKTHGQSHTTSPKMYIDNRGSNAIDVLDSSTNSITKTIYLDFYPRSIAVEENTGLVAVSGTNKPMIAIINGKTDDLLTTAGTNTITYPTTTGHDYVSSGTLASGHPHWLDNEHFVLIDRQNKKIITYKLIKNGDTYSTQLVNEINTPSPVHNLIPPKVHGGQGHNNGNSTYPVFYATAEGSDTAFPSIMKLYFSPSEGLKLLENLELNKSGLSKNIMGVHHLNFIKKAKKIYVGSDEGTLFVVDYSTSPMKVTKTIQAGLGAGHSAQIEHSNLAIIINHKDKFITVMNTSTDTKIADINVSNLGEDKIGNVQTQSHPQYHFSKDDKYFYIFLTEEGELVKVDLDSKQVVNRLDLGGKIPMGSFIESH